MKNKFGESSVKTLVADKYYIMETEDGKYYLYNHETEQAESDEMDTPEEVNEWFASCSDN